MKKRDTVTLMESIADGVVQPVGMVHVKIKNERGKSIHEESKPNFISKVWKAHARALLRQPWMFMGYNRQMLGQTAADTGNSVWPNGNRGTVPMLPIQAIGCWNDTAAEDSVNEDKIYLPPNATGMVAWATRWPVGSPTGARGSVDATDSLIDDDTARFVFNWTATQGNGTFQSVGWFHPAAPGIPGTFWGTELRGQFASNPTPSTIITGATQLYPGSPWIDPATGRMYMAVGRNTTSGLMRIVSFDTADLLDDANYGILGTRALESGVTMTTESDEFTPNGSNNGSSFSSQVIGIDSSGNYIFIVFNGANNWRWGKIPASGASTTYAHPTGTTLGLCGAVIGNAVYLGADSASSIYQMLSTDGSLTATHTIDANVTALCTLAGIVSPRILSMTTDGTDLYCIYTSSTSSSAWLLVRLNTSGVLQQVYGLVPHYHTTGFQSEATSAPFGGTMVWNRGNWYTESISYPFSVDGSSASQTTEDLLSSQMSSALHDASMWLTVQTTWAARYVTLCYYDNTLFLVEVNTSGTGVMATVHRLAGNLGSRVKLASPAVKANPNTMEITYDITLPGWF